MYAWKPLLAFALLLALVIAGLYAGYKVTEPQGDRTNTALSCHAAGAVHAVHGLII